MKSRDFLKKFSSTSAVRDRGCPPIVSYAGNRERVQMAVLLNFYVPLGDISWQQELGCCFS